MAKEDEIRLIAYNIWEQEGHPDGKDVEHYLRAKKILEEKAAAPANRLATPTASDLTTPPAKQVDLLQGPSKRIIRARHTKKMRA